ncbi:hypothetical protein DFJ73DRAFT_962112 [Zopfochytrium polystomum]|nr:hypothetical protein DFJ73DRAFT_962112 [Zopfochytrium polystomum]
MLPAADAWLLCLTLGFPCVASILWWFAAAAAAVATTSQESPSSAIIAAWLSPPPSSSPYPFPNPDDVAATCNRILRSYAAADAAASALALVLCALCALGVSRATALGIGWKLSAGAETAELTTATALGRATAMPTSRPWWKGGLWRESCAVRAWYGAVAAGILKIGLAFAIAYPLFSEGHNGCLFKTNVQTWTAVAIHICFVVATFVTVTGLVSATDHCGGARYLFRVRWLERLWIFLIGLHSITVVVLTTAALVFRRSWSADFTCDRRTVSLLLGEFTASAASALLLLLGAVASAARWRFRGAWRGWDPRPRAAWEPVFFALFLQLMALLLGTAAVGKSPACGEDMQSSAQLSRELHATRCAVNLCLGIIFVADKLLPLAAGDARAGNGVSAPGSALARRTLRRLLRRLSRGFQLRQEPERDDAAAKGTTEPSDASLPVAFSNTVTTTAATASPAYDARECPICCAAFHPGSALRELNGCRHSFHEACLELFFAAAVARYENAGEEDGDGGVGGGDGPLRVECPVCRAAPVERALPAASGFFGLGGWDGDDDAELRGEARETGV